MITLANARFRMGRIVTAPNALLQLTQGDILIGIQRHQSGDWGDVDETDRQVNECALTSGARLISVYQSSQGVKFWLITEADRSVTTVLLPEEDSIAAVWRKAEAPASGGNSLTKHRTEYKERDLPAAKARKLKIEATGDFAMGKVRPQIRLKGLWLADAGFKPGKSVEVSVLKDGLLKLEVREDGAPAC